MIMAAVSLGRRPTLEQMKTGLAGNLCRCTGYSAIYRSIAATTPRKNRGDRKARGGSAGKDINGKRRTTTGRNRKERRVREGND
jgi:xanthine dehydrogenase iron-sulfur cluster and FAD-binding subunit A